MVRRQPTFFIELTDPKRKRFITEMSLSPLVVPSSSLESSELFHDSQHSTTTTFDMNKLVLCLTSAFLLLHLTESRVEVSSCLNKKKKIFVVPANTKWKAFWNHIGVVQRNGYRLSSAMPRLRMFAACRTDMEEPAAYKSWVRSSDELFGIKDKVAKPLSEDQSSWLLDEVLPTDPEEVKSHTCSAFMGENVDIYVADTGCNPWHAEFEGRTVRTAPAPHSRFTSGLDDNGHGTTVASILAGRKTGLLQKPNIMCVKVLDKDGRGELADILSVLQMALWQRAVDKRDLAPKGTFVLLPKIPKGSLNRKLLDTAITRAANQGVVTFTPSGDDSEDSCSETPAADSSIIVGSVNRNGELSRFSNFGSCLSVVAPGESVHVAFSNGTNGYKLSSGTSLSTAVVAGLVALSWNHWHMGDARRGETRAVRELFKKISRKTKSGFIMPQLDGRCNRPHSGHGKIVSMVIGIPIGSLAIIAVLGTFYSRCYFSWWNRNPHRQQRPVRELWEMEWPTPKQSLADSERSLHVRDFGNSMKPQWEDREVPNGNRPTVRRNPHAYGLWGKTPRRWKGFSPKKFSKYDERWDGRERDFLEGVDWNNDIDIEPEDMEALERDLKLEGRRALAPRDNRSKRWQVRRLFQEVDESSVDIDESSGGGNMIVRIFADDDGKITPVLYKDEIEAEAKLAAEAEEKITPVSSEEEDEIQVNPVDLSEVVIHSGGWGSPKPRYAPLYRESSARRMTIQGRPRRKFLGLLLVSR